jgi:hypothetical protein
MEPKKNSYQKKKRWGSNDFRQSNKKLKNKNKNKRNQPK